MKIFDIITFCFYPSIFFNFITSVLSENCSFLLLHNNKIIINKNNTTLNL